MGKIVMPKNSALLDEIEAVLKIYYEANGWLSNDDYKTKLKNIIGDDQYSSSYTKKAQITSYFGFTEWEDIHNARSLRRITAAGKQMYEALCKKDDDAIQELLMRALETVTFGRNNYGCPDSNSDVEPPAVFVRAILDMGYFTYKEFAYALWRLEDCGGNYTDVLEEIKGFRSQGILELNEEATKYTDCKPIMILNRWGFLDEDTSDSTKGTGGTRIVIKQKVKDKYLNRLRALKIYNIDMFTADLDVEDSSSISCEITPEWFKEKALEFPTLDQEAEEFRQTFIGKFSPDKLKNLADMELLETIFLNANNKTNLCYTLEFDTDSRFIFGSIKSGTAYKYGLHYSQKNGSWATGTGRNPQLLSEEEAIELGTKIRDNLVAGVEVLEELKDVQFIDDYEELYSRLFQVTDGFINRVWFLKYYAILFPTIFPPNYSANAQNTIIEKLALNKSDNTVIRMGIIRDYVDKCELSGVVFSRIFWKYCNNKDDDTEINEDEEIKEEENTMLNCLEKERNPRTVKIHPLNSIIYGAPGTGKTYSTSEYAQAIIEGVSLETFRANNPDRKEVMKKYNELVKAGQVVFTTFHQSYGYEEFIQGLRPDTTSDKMNFKTVDGVFKKIADRALNDDENNYVIIIDEINRANISKVFGELITLIEDDKRWGELNQTSATLQSGDPFAVPNNLYIVGTMNSADKSISLIDAALRRRFEFIEQKPDASLITDPTMRSILIKLNDMLADQLDSADLLIGHSYFMNKTVDDLPKVLNNSIIPLLYEYFYDNKKKVMGVLNNAVEQVDYVIEDDKLGRIYVERQTRH